jgi:hypothetical protein
MWRSSVSPVWLATVTVVVLLLSPRVNGAKPLISILMNSSVLFFVRLHVLLSRNVHHKWLNYFAISRSRNFIFQGGSRSFYIVCPFLSHDLSLLS